MIIENNAENVETVISSEQFDNSLDGFLGSPWKWPLLFKRKATEERIKQIQYYTERLQNKDLASDERERYEKLRSEEVNALDKDEADFEKNTLIVIFGCIVAKKFLDNPEQFVNAIKTLGECIGKLNPHRLLKA